MTILKFLPALFAVAMSLFVIIYITPHETTVFSTSSGQFWLGFSALVTLAVGLFFYAFIDYKTERRDI